MLVNYKKETLDLFQELENNPSLIRKWEKGVFRIRCYTIQLFECRGICDYESFKKMINTLSPYEDDLEIERFWNGWFFSEAFLDFCLDLFFLISEMKINITPFITKNINHEIN